MQSSYKSKNFRKNRGSTLTEEKSLKYGEVISIKTALNNYLNKKNKPWRFNKF